MSKRAIEKSYEAYPLSDDNRYDVINSPRRLGYLQGYEQAEKDTIERAVKWLEIHADEYNGSESSFDHMEEEMVADFRKALEEE